MGVIARRPHHRKTSFVANIKDDSLETLMSAAFNCLEDCFHHLDGDSSGIITYTTFVNQLALRGFHDHAALDLVWNHVHQHNAGSVDFSEFLSLMFLWGEVGSYDVILETPANCEAVKQAFAALQSEWVYYDKDKDRRFDHDELQKFMLEKMPHILERSQAIIDLKFPKSQSGGLSFPRFMHLLYCCFAELPQSVSSKKYVDNGVMKHTITTRKSEALSADLACEQSVAWEFLHKAFAVLEHDFRFFDKDTDGNVELRAITAGVPSMAGVHQFDVLSRLEGAYDKAGLDRNGGLDFNDFLYLVFVMTRDGSYSNVVGSSRDHSQARDPDANPPPPPPPPFTALSRSPPARSAWPWCTCTPSSSRCWRRTPPPPSA